MILQNFHLTISIGLFLLQPNYLMAQESTTSFAVGKYADSNVEGYENNQRLSKLLTIPDANELEVSIQGDTEKCCDFVTIHSADKQEVGKFSGHIEEKLQVEGNTIEVIFRSDNRTSREGVLVTISSPLAAEIFNGIKKQLLTASESILKGGTIDIQAKLQNTLATFKTLRIEMSRAPVIDTVLYERVANELVVIARTYKEIAATAPNIKEVHHQQFNIINQLKSRTTRYLEKFEEEQQNYQDLITKTQLELSNQSDPDERRKLEYSIKTYKSTREALADQRESWKKLSSSQDDFEQKIKNHAVKISFLLHILEMNAKVYEETANLALLGKITMTQLIEHTDARELRGIIDEVAISENEIAQWNGKLQQTQF
jgi:hypothetical protein